MITSKKHIDVIVAKYLVGEATPQEHDLLQGWMSASVDNRKYVDELRLVYEKAGNCRPFIPVDTEKAWQTVKAKMNSQPAPTEVVKRKSYPLIRNRWMQVAAIFLLVLVSAAVFHLLSGKQQDEVKYTIASNSQPVTHAFGGNAQVCLNKNSSIVFKQNKKEKKKELILSGEAFIHVTHASDTQLVVKAQETLIEDIGTSFNVKAVPGSPTIEVFVQDGEVSFYTNTQSGILLHKGETGIYCRKTKTFTKTNVANPNAVAYKTRKFVFVNARLSDVIKQLNAAYSDAILLGDNKLGNQTITVTFNNEKTASIVDVMSATLGLTVSKTEKGYLLNALDADN
ncbi:MAG: FecR domain-containing protein [Paludibacteraceae bacterium]|nr:FecR domain-containing protein [Paludibacteraceae bacterium]